MARSCRALGVSRSGFYAWLRRGESRRSREDRELTGKIVQVFAESRGTYGAPRIRAALRLEGIRVGRKRIARLMREAGLQAVTRRRRVRTTVSTHRPPPAPDLVGRRFSVTGPDRLWVADITYVPTRKGFIYLAVILDAWSRRVVGWSVGDRLETDLVVGALEMALTRRRPQGVIHHSDRGTQYTSHWFRMHCLENGVKTSMGRTGDCYDNAMAESFFATLECELLALREFRSREEARRELFAFIEGWYNTRRLHSAIGYHAPAAFERLAENEAAYASPTVH